jgi:urease accessory protein
MPRCNAALAIALFAAIPAAFAHPGHAGGDAFAAGFAHPLLGADHLLAMLAVGLWAARRGGAARWTLPAAFLAFMLIGALLAVPGAPLAAAEQGAAASVFVLGLAVVAAARLATPFALACVAAFAVFHGYAHGVESAGEPVFFAGMLGASALLHGTGIALGAALAGRRGWLPPALGGAVALAGAWLAFA